MKHLLTAACLALISTHASALSCLAPHVANSYLRADQSEAKVAILLGQIAFDGTDVTQDQMQEGITLPGRFTGVQLGPNGQSAQMTQDITVSLSCLGPWCGDISTAPNTVSFVDVTDNAYTITSNACGGVQFSADEPGVLDALQSCLSGGACEAQ